MDDNFSIKTQVFEGPLDLLLNLIEKRKLLINDVSLAQITDDYINYLKNKESITIENQAHFILIASTLLLIKSKSLLPNLDLSDEEQKDIKDLETRLKIHKILKNFEPEISLMYLKNPMFNKKNIVKKQIVFAPSKQINFDYIKNTILEIIKSLPKIEKVANAIIKKTISLEEMIHRLTQRIKNSISMSFRDFSDYDKKDKVNIIVSFLAMLELVKEGIIETEQNNYTEDIKIQTKKIDLPNYS
ncbi:MAG TPA: ScpA family protein [Candidatus Paceibacterota bacterium]|nr:ScpA family protein [Candidatus Paceibacterota bacterium]HMP18741.1 ScpA family protein [Candidatus Paceibacterota bacterium]HMP85252.1 ScpA family protein [Candidatus Paceibacterota bacterium]